MTSQTQTRTRIQDIRRGSLRTRLRDWERVITPAGWRKTSSRRMANLPHRVRPRLLQHVAPRRCASPPLTLCTIEAWQQRSSVRPDFPGEAASFAVCSLDVQRACCAFRSGLLECSPFHHEVQSLLLCIACGLPGCALTASFLHLTGCH